MKYIIIALLLSLPLTVSADEKCVTKKEVLNAIYSLISRDDSYVTTLECNPCSCGSGYGSAACLQYLADQQKVKEEIRSKSWDVIRRFEGIGLCKEPDKEGATIPDGLDTTGAASFEGLTGSTTDAESLANLTGTGEHPCTDGVNVFPCPKD